MDLRATSRNTEGQEKSIWLGKGAWNNRRLRNTQIPFDAHGQRRFVLTREGRNTQADRKESGRQGSRDLVSGQRATGSSGGNVALSEGRTGSFEILQRALGK